MAAPVYTACVSAHTSMAPEQMLRFLGDIANHWSLSPRFELVGRARDGDVDGALVRVHGPLGMQRLVQTRVLAVERPCRLHGDARSNGSAGTVTWTCAPAAHGRDAELRLCVVVQRASKLDRLLLWLGGGRWLQRELDRIVQRVAGMQVGTPRAAPARESAAATGVPATSRRQPRPPAFHRSGEGYADR